MIWAVDSLSLKSALSSRSSSYEQSACYASHIIAQAGHQVCFTTTDTAMKIQPPIASLNILNLISSRHVIIVFFVRIKGTEAQLTHWRWQVIHPKILKVSQLLLPLSRRQALHIRKVQVAIPIGQFQLIAFGSVLSTLVVPSLKRIQRSNCERCCLIKSSSSPCSSKKAKTIGYRS